MKKIIFIASTLNTGGAQKVLSNLVMNLPMEYEATIVLNDTENIVYPYRGNLISLGFAAKQNKMDLFYQFLVFLKRVKVLRKLKKAGEYTAAVSFLDSANVANILSGNRYCRTIVSVHNNLTESASSKIYKYLVNPMVRFLYGKADQVVTVSKGIEYDLVHNLKLSPKNIVTIYNGHDIEKIRKMSEEPVPEECKSWVEGKGPFLVTMGRMNYQKGQWHLIRAMRKIVEQYPEAKLLLLGDGELRDLLEALMQKYQLEQNIILCGFMDNPFAILKHCDLYVFPSLFEGFPNALIEALAVGVPCVSADFHSGAREILAPDLSVDGESTKNILYAQFGVLVPVCDGKWRESEKLTREEEILADAVLEVLGDQDRMEQYRAKTAEAVVALGSDMMVSEWMKVMETGR